MCFMSPYEYLHGRWIYHLLYSEDHTYSQQDQAIIHGTESSIHQLTLSKLDKGIGTKDSLQNDFHTLGLYACCIGLTHRE